MSHSLAQKVSLKPSLSPKSDPTRPKPDFDPVEPGPENKTQSLKLPFLAKTQIQSFHTGRKSVLQLIYVIQIFVKSRLSNRIQRIVKSMVLMLLMLHAVLMAGFFLNLDQFIFRPLGFFSEN